MPALLAEHPRGLAFLAFTEAWERFSFAGMQTLLVLYMIEHLLLPGNVDSVLGFAKLQTLLEYFYGHLDPQPLSSVIFGWYTALVFFVPVFGGVLGDRVFGQHKMVVAGALLMVGGHVLMAFEVSFLIALSLLILGCGCMKGNISTQVGGLYADNDRRRTDAFQVYSVAMTSGVIAAPLICGTLGELYGWSYGFGAAGLGMLIGLGIYLSGTRYLPTDQRLERSIKPPVYLPADRRLLSVLTLTFLVTTCFLASAGQLGNVYNLWLKSAVDRSLTGSFVIPVTWFQSLTPLVAVLGTPWVLRRWKRLADRGVEPDLLRKMTHGLLMTAAGLLLLAWFARRLPTSGDAVGWFWLLPVHALVGFGYVYVYPVGLALFSRAAPHSARAMYIGIFFLTSFVASNAVGWIGRFYSSMTPAQFWIRQAAIAGGGAVLILILGRWQGAILRDHANH